MKHRPTLRRRRSTTKSTRQNRGLESQHSLLNTAKISEWMVLPKKASTSILVPVCGRMTGKPDVERPENLAGQVPLWEISPEGYRETRQGLSIPALRPNQNS
jgi:hypothetical protein